MRFQQSRFVCSLMAAVFAAAFTVSPGFAQQESQHLVTPGQLQQSSVNASKTRQQNIDTLRKILSTPEAQKAFKQAHADPTEVKQAVSSLSDQELAQLASRASKAQRDFAAGGISDMELVFILLGIILLILLIHFA